MSTNAYESEQIVHYGPDDPVDEERSLNVREARIFEHLLAALEPWTENAEDDGDEDTLMAVEPMGGRTYCFRFADGSTVTARLEVHCL